jgi:hypothetical protein
VSALGRFVGGPAHGTVRAFDGGMPSHLVVLILPSLADLYGPPSGSITPATFTYTRQRQPHPDGVWEYR